jgi:hypothetical protein
MLVSAHFSLKDFLTHNQQHIWPKYLVLREPLLDKLELVIQDLERHNVRAAGCRFLSGFRTPEYNQELGDESGRARDSRHQFGDAADVIIDNDGNGRMDDLNRDGRLTFARRPRCAGSGGDVLSASIPISSVDGLYHSSGPSGPFAHIDVRGSKARWVRGGHVREEPASEEVSRSKSRTREELFPRREASRLGEITFPSPAGTLQRIRVSNK